MNTFILPFSTPDATLAIVGGKGANLSRMTRAGFPVPPGFLITTAAYRAFVQANDLQAQIVALASDPANTSEDSSAAIRWLFEQGRIPPEVAAAIQSAYAELLQASGDSSPVAVRSSATAEDLPSASFAGQQETYLNVRGEQALLDAVKRCWSSLWTARALEYRARQGIDSATVRLAVVVQVMVPADAAGVAFTAHPLTGDRTETVVSAVRGLGERLVSGQASPDEWVVKGTDASCQRAPEGAIDAAQALAVAELARRVERHFGSPQDIEWAIAAGQLYLLQARPITVIPEQQLVLVPIEPPPGFWRRESSHYPQPLSPMFRVVQAAFNASMREMMSDFSLLAEAIEFREIGGWVYQRMIPLGGKDRPAPPAWLMPLLIRVVPQLRTRINGCVAVVRSDKIGSYLQRWYAEWKPELTATIVQLRDIDHTRLSDAELDQHVAAVIAFLQRSLGIHTRINRAVLVTLAEIGFACRNLLGWDDRKTFDLFSGLSEKSSAPARHLAQLARERPRIRTLLEQLDDHAVERLADADRDFAAAFASYEREFGCRALHEVATPTLAETPTLALNLIRDQIVRDYDPNADAAALAQKRAATIAEARTALASRSAQERECFERALARGEQAYPLREDNQFYAVSAPLALLRYAALEIGRRLAERGQLVQRDDVFFLELDEARAALRGSVERLS